MPTVEDAIAAFQARDYSTARDVCTQFADVDSHARYMLASMLAYGQGGPPDPVCAAEHYRIAAEAGHTLARFCLGSLLAQGRGVEQDLAGALRWYRLAGEDGYPEAMYRVGAMIANGEGTAQDLVEAARWWEKGAAAGNAHAMQGLGHLLAEGTDQIPRDPGLAAYWFFKAWQQGLDAAGNDIVRVRAELESAAEAGSAVAQNTLGLIFCFGHSEPGAARAWFEHAAAQHHPEALRMLGYLYGEGQGVPKDEELAARYYQQAAEHGDGYAQFNLAAMIDQALGGLQRDLNLAIKWLRRAANQGMVQAELRLAELLAERNQDRRDANEAVQRLWNVARSAPPDAEFRIVAGDGSWSVVMKERGKVVAMPGLRSEELVGLPDEE